MKVPELKAFLRERGWRSTGTKEELVALAYAAEQQGVPVIPTAKEERISKECQYRSLLTVNGEILPDPFELSGWLKEEDSLDKWPPTMLIDITEFLLKSKDGGMAKRLLGDYKEGKAFSYVESNFIDTVSYHPISHESQLCFLKSQSLPSQCHSQSPHQVWILIQKKNGKVESAYCTCFAG